MQFTDLAFRQSHQSYAGEAKLLVQAGNVLLIAREAVEGLGDKNLKAACPGIFEHLLIAGAQGGGAADGVVGIDLAELPLLLLDPVRPSR